jgi:hypothetical protein
VAPWALAAAAAAALSLTCTIEYNTGRLLIAGVKANVNRINKVAA